MLVIVLMTNSADSHVHFLVTTLTVDMFENPAFTVFSFFHNCNLSQEQYLKPDRTVTSQLKSLM